MFLISKAKFPSLSFRLPIYIFHSQGSSNNLVYNLDCLGKYFFTVSLFHMFSFLKKKNMQILKKTLTVIHTVPNPTFESSFIS